MDLLRTLMDVDLKTIGINQFGNRRKLLLAFAKLDNQCKLITGFIFSMNYMLVFKIIINVFNLLENIF